MINAASHIPLKDEKYQLLINNCFTLQELIFMCNAVAGTLRFSLDQAQKNPNQKDTSDKEASDILAACVGKLLLALPPPEKQMLLKLFYKELNLDLTIHEVFEPDEKTIN